MELTAYRDRFPILAETTYLINHSLGAMPAETEERLAEYARVWANARDPRLGRGVVDDAARGRRPDRADHRRAARHDGDAPERRGRRGGRALVLSAGRPAPKPGRLRGRELPLGALPLPGPARARGRRLRRRRTRSLEAIDERTLLVPISHVLFKSAEIQDVAAIVARAHEVGARVVLDCYQSAGIVPFSVAELGVDFAVGGSVKWLCGGPGNGWLYVRPDLIETLEPTFTGWQAHAAPFAFEPELRYADGVARFLTGTPNVPALYAATSGYALIEEIGVERIRENSLRQTALLIALADAAGFEVRSPREPGAPRRHRSPCTCPTSRVSTRSSANAA